MSVSRFFKKPRECECYVIKYVDRIWLSEIGDADVLRTFIVKVNENSPKPLKEIRILLPFKDIENLESVNETCFLPPSQYYFNSSEVASTREYQVIQQVNQSDRFDRFGIINHDGIQNVKVFPLIDYSLYQIGNCLVIRLQFPQKEGLKKGECTEVRLRFQVTSLFNKITTGFFPNYSIELPYFPPQYVNEIDQLDIDKKLEIKVKPILGLAESQFKGGFDIFLYFPPGFEKVTGFNPFKEKYDSFNIEGKRTSEKKLKLLWRLREFLRQRGSPEDSLTGIGQNILISGTLIKRYDTEDLIDTMSKRLPQNRILRIETYSTFWLSCAAIILAFIAILFTFLKK